MTDSTQKSILELRREYTRGSLDLQDLAQDPIEQFHKWFQEAHTSLVNDPIAMTLSTVSHEGQPSSRIVLLRGADSQGFRFYTNYTSHKAQDLAANPRAGLSFFWSELDRQILIEGTVQKLTEEESKQYFSTRPRGNQLSAWASDQSKAVASREELERVFEKYENQFPDEIPKPEFWGGYLVTPIRIEFWQGRASRLHDRFLYTREATSWKISRLAP